MMQWCADMPGWGGHWFGGLLVLLFWVLVVVGVVAIARWLVARPGSGPRPGPESPLEILKRRYAAGEIDRAEFEERRKDILGS